MKVAARAYQDWGTRRICANLERRKNVRLIRNLWIIERKVALAAVCEIWGPPQVLGGK